MPQSFSGSIVICYVLLVLWMTSFIPWANEPEWSTMLCLKEVRQVAVPVGHQDNYSVWLISPECNIGKGKGKMYSSSQTASPLRELMCHMGSHSVTCHPAEVTFPLLPQLIKAGTQFSDPRGMQGWVDLVGWFHTEVVYSPEDGHPSQY